jgi:hypothetical protein
MAESSTKANAEYGESSHCVCRWFDLTSRLEC